MRKNLTLTFILIIATFSNFTFAKVPLKWRRDGLFGVLQARKSYVGILSNYSSLVERQVECPAGYFECPGVVDCCTQTCDSCMECFQCCREGYCRTGLSCITTGEYYNNCEDTEDILPCIYDFFDNLGISPDAAADGDSTENSEEDTSPCKPGKFKKSSAYYRSQAEKAPFAYIYDSSDGTLSQTASVSTINRGEVDADHVFEAQIVKNYLNGDGIIILSYITTNSIYSDELLEIMNDVTNMRYVSKIVNIAKGIYFGGQNVSNQTLLNAVKDLLVIPDIHDAFSKTRTKVIGLFRKIVSENKLDVPNFDKIDNLLGRTEYESLTNKSLVIDGPSNNSSSTLPFLHLPVILSVILSLVFLVSGGCSQRITRMSISHIMKN